MLEPCYEDLFSTTHVYRDFEARLKSYELVQWPKTLLRAQPYSLALAGFYFEGPTKDRTRCAYCLKILKNWQPQDCPFLEHKRHFPDCIYVNRFRLSPEKALVILDACRLKPGFKSIIRMANRTRSED